jgi:hypothetical protein
MSLGRPRRGKWRAATGYSTADPEKERERLGVFYNKIRWLRESERRKK